VVVVVVVVVVPPQRFEREAKGATKTGKPRLLGMAQSRLCFDTKRPSKLATSPQHRCAPTSLSLVINIYFLFCRTNSVRDLIFV
jgi:hypothetical protein